MEVFKENKRLFCLDVPGVAEKRPSVLPRDHLFVCPLDQHGVQDRTEYQGCVHDVLNERVVLGFGKKLMDIFLPNMKFAVRFVVSRHPLRVQHRAVQLAAKHNCMPWLFPTAGSIKMHPVVSDNSSLKLKLYDRKLEANKQQFQAVQHIVAGTARPGPYLVFGPPGTGKSVTLVEAMKQVLRVYPDAHLLVCAPSNSAADLLAERLLPHVEKRFILRLNASSRIAIPATIKDCSNYIQGEGVYFPNKDDLSGYRVIVSTLITAGRIASAKFPSGHFTHVFIDECGQAQETEGVVALAGILDDHSVNPRGGHLILAGDPRQLGSVLRSPVAKKYGLDKSLLERLMDDTEVYSPKNAHCFTKLLKNYRSHPAILKLPSQLFYNDELEACADLALRNSLCNWEGLPKKNFPIVFHGVIGEDMREDRSPSFFNPQEVDVVVGSVEDLLNAKGFRAKQKDIGVISPYRKQVGFIQGNIQNDLTYILTHISQVMKIRSVFKKKKWDDIKVGSTEEFQGQERLVIIISTVRSCTDHLKDDFTFSLGFLSQPKRFNVAVTRAKALLIMIGNPIILRHDEHWGSMIEYCLSNGSFLGEEPDKDEEMEDIFERFKDLGLASALGEYQIISFYIHSQFSSSFFFTFSSSQSHLQKRKSAKKNFKRILNGERIIENDSQMQPYLQLISKHL
ncbi:hypothetical protein CAPTEDRAFT_119799 [Capitella teleta]|uniref:RNA helicase n=1 Tax=Capitella teleta TaxID=283909 RepID=R7UVH0_CAPTE|nr:hypothetical protein CAPTEDRAFT_119799 [Capitella teleta]|eukprot:ELU10294.1 hypothetical protein CAPTEDRAFT_119799 [Capitella teleta]